MAPCRDGGGTGADRGRTQEAPGWTSESRAPEQRRAGGSAKYAGVVSVPTCRPWL